MNVQYIQLANNITTTIFIYSQLQCFHTLAMKIYSFKKKSQTRKKIINCNIEVILSIYQFDVDFAALNT